MNYVYLHSEHSAEHDLFTVGFYDPQGKWHPESDHSTKEEAAKRVRYLNGGKDKTVTTTTTEILRIWR